MALFDDRKRRPIWGVVKIRSRMVFRPTKSAFDDRKLRPIWGVINIRSRVFFRPTKSAFGEHKAESERLLFATMLMQRREFVGSGGWSIFHEYREQSVVSPCYAAPGTIVGSTRRYSCHRLGRQCQCGVVR